MDTQPTLFVKIDDYNQVAEILDEIKGKMEEAKKAMETLMELKAKEDAELQSWQDGLDQINERMHFIEQTVFNR
ncbi:hypothetical protein HYW21_04000 [Candidatus Woesearchaeota archaeon]|nr:hypothetical protein [Candidatus Woesearchaeota archaeon]